MNRRFVMLAVAAGCLGALVWLIATHPNYTRASASKESASCVAGANEKCPTQKFLDDYDYWDKTLRAKVENSAKDPAVKEMNRLDDEFRGMAARLANAQPKGYQFNSNSRKFVADPPGGATAPTTAP